MSGGSSLRRGPVRPRCRFRSRPTRRPAARCDFLVARRAAAASAARCRVGFQGTGACCHRRARPGVPAGAPTCGPGRRGESWRSSVAATAGASARRARPEDGTAGARSARRCGSGGPRLSVSEVAERPPDTLEISRPAAVRVGSCVVRRRLITVRTAASEGRAPGSFASMVSTSWIISSGSSGTWSRIEGGGSSACCISVASGSPLDGNGRWPLMI